MTAMTALPPQPACPESGAWDDVRAGWRQVYGSFERLGVSVETHDFHCEGTLDWGRSFHPESVEICLNLGGGGVVGQRRESTVFEADTAGFYVVGDEALRAYRNEGERHRFVTIELGREFLACNLAGCEVAVDSAVRRSIFDGKRQSAVARARPLTAAQREFARALAEPPVTKAAVPLWYQSKVMEATSLFLFPPQPELFCTRQRRLAGERVERVREILRRRLDDPPALDELGREVGVSQFYLSRLFSQEMQMTIPQFLRRLRMERAAELLRAGTHNVTEAAFAVGYSSLGHFSKSFCEVIGCCPALYPQARGLARSR